MNAELQALACEVKRQLLRHWLKSASRATQNGCDRFLRRDVSGRWCCTESDLRQWVYWRIAGRQR